MNVSTTVTVPDAETGNPATVTVTATPETNVGGNITLAQIAINCGAIAIAPADAAAIASVLAAHASALGG